MKLNKVLALSAIYIIYITLASCGTKNPQEIIAKELGINLSNGITISNTDTHGGFHGDGHTYIVLKFDDDSLLKVIKNNSKWRKFPLDKTFQTLVYGREEDTSKTGPFVTDGQGNSLIPEIQNGYWFLIDRHSDTKTDILERGSFNFTLGLYDTDNNIIYFYKLDT